MKRRRIYRFRNSWELKHWVYLGMVFLCLALPQQALAVPKTLGVNPISLVHSCLKGQNATSQSLEVWNSGAGTLAFSISADANWLSVTPTVGTSAGEHRLITVNYSTSTLSVGVYRATINITAPAATNSPVQISVELTVTGVVSPWLFLLLD